MLGNRSRFSMFGSPQIPEALLRSLPRKKPTENDATDPSRGREATPKFLSDFLLVSDFVAYETIPNEINVINQYSNNDCIISNCRSFTFLGLQNLIWTLESDSSADYFCLAACPNFLNDPKCHLHP